MIAAFDGVEETTSVGCVSEVSGVGERESVASRVGVSNGGSSSNPTEVVGGVRVSIDWTSVTTETSFVSDGTLAGALVVGSLSSERIIGIRFKLRCAVSEVVVDAGAAQVEDIRVSAIYCPLVENQLV